MIKTKFATWGAAALVVFASSTAWADIPPPDSQQCDGKAAGTSCTTDKGKSGACINSSCGHLNYDCDGGNDGGHGPCGTTSSPCMLCQVSDGGTTGGGGTSSGCSVTPGIAGPACFSWLVAGIVPLVLRRRRTK